MLKHQPNSSRARSRLSSFRHPWMYDLYLEGLRKAGLPETRRALTVAPLRTPP